MRTVKPVFRKAKITLREIQARRVHTLTIHCDSRGWWLTQTNPQGKKLCLNPNSHRDWRRDREAVPYATCYEARKALYARQQHMLAAVAAYGSKPKVPANRFAVKVDSFETPPWMME